MRSLDDIYQANGEVRERLRAAVSGLTDEQLSARPEGEKWSIAQVVEHINIVNEASIKICSKLLAESEAKAGGASSEINLGETFGPKSREVAGVKLEAPERVQPNAGRSVSESLEQLVKNAQTLEEMKAMFAERDCTNKKFPHPFFGDLNAHEWLILSGGHETRHLAQIEKIKEKL